MLDHRDKIHDFLGMLADSLVTPVLLDAVALIRGTAVVAGAGLIDTGGGFTEGNLVINVSANSEGWKTGCTAGVGATSTDQILSFVLQGSTTTTFATQCPLLQLSFGVDPVAAKAANHTFPLIGFAWGAVTADMAVAKHFVKPFNNTYENRVYRWLRLYTAFAGTWGTGINYMAFLTK